MGKVVIGTSGYSYDDWLGPVYPPGTEKKDFLAFYTTLFSLVELNFSYYRQPSSALIGKMVKNTPENFLFTIKAHQSLTHKITGSFPRDLDQYKKGIEPLMSSGRLGCVLFQFPYSFHYSPPNRVYLDRLLKLMDGYPAAVEFRGAEWQLEPVINGLRDRGIGSVNIDVPPLEHLPRPRQDITGFPGYVRFHGRNSAMWWTGDNTTRYDYLYSREELEEWVPGIMEMAGTAKLLIAAFNNHYKGQAVRNGLMLKKMLEEKGLDIG